jgi:hypothetical protein
LVEGFNERENQLVMRVLGVAGASALGIGVDFVVGDFVLGFEIMLLGLFPGFPKFDLEKPSIKKPRDCEAIFFGWRAQRDYEIHACILPFGAALVARPKLLQTILSNSRPPGSKPGTLSS